MEDPFDGTKKPPNSPSHPSSAQKRKNQTTMFSTAMQVLKKASQTKEGFDVAASSLNKISQGTARASEHFWYDEMELALKPPHHYITDAQKEDLIRRFPSYEELLDPMHWYNVTRRLAFDIANGPQCPTCGYQGHEAEFCPSPRRWLIARLEIDIVIPHHRGQKWIRDKLNGTFKKVRPTTSWLHMMDVDVFSGSAARLSQAKKQDLIDHFPTEGELQDDENWYSKAVPKFCDVYDPLQCSMCGFHGHTPQSCPSPRKMRKEKEGKMKKEWL
ncbi:hypothetical protein ACP4OV_030358 [Aristida adscensionis]